MITYEHRTHVIEKQRGLRSSDRSPCMTYLGLEFPRMII